MSAFEFPKPKSTVSDWARVSDSDGQDVWVYKPTGGSVKSTPEGWRYRLGLGWSEVVPNLGAAMHKAMGCDDGFEIMF